MENQPVNTELNFEDILKEVQKTQRSIKTKPAHAMDYLGVGRRGWRVVETVNNLLDKYDVISDPGFGDMWWIYGDIEIKPKLKASASKSTQNENGFSDSGLTPKLSLLKAANIGLNIESNGGSGLISVTRDAKLSEAITLMLLHDFSQLPILSNKKEDGIISWRSIGRGLALGNECITVNDCKEEVVVLKSEEPLSNAVKIILEKEVVLVIQKDKTICGIVTASDIAEHFISLSEPFLIIGQIENHIRKLLDEKFSIVELKSSIDLNDRERKVDSSSDLTLGECIKIIENPEKFEKLFLKIDRKVIIKQLDEVRQIRNDVMHFAPDGITPSEIDLLKQTANFFHTLSISLKRRRSI